jgi:hypothetical protein
MIFRSCCCNPKTTFTAGSLDTYINPPAKNSITAMWSLGGLYFTGGRNWWPASADLAGRGPRDAREAHPLRFELTPWLEVGASGAVGGAPLVRPLLPAAGWR